MYFTDIQPFVRYMHYVPLDKSSEYSDTIPYDNRLFFACKGIGKIKADDKVYTLRQGAVLIVPSGIPYQILTPDTEVTYIAINFDYFFEHSDLYKPIPPDSTVSYNPDRQVEKVTFSDNHSFNEVFFAGNLMSLNESFAKLYKEYTQKLIFSDRILSNLLSEILFSCARASTFGESKNAGETVNQLIDYIRENYNKNITNQTIAERFNLHPNYISNLIKAFTGMPLHRYVLYVRISVSMQMLSHSNSSVTEIAEKCGFSDVYHFSKIFKKLIGVSPTKYK